MNSKIIIVDVTCLANNDVITLKKNKRGKTNYMQQIGKKGLLLSCIFVYIYSIQFNGFPVSCNILLGLIGICIYILNLIKSQQSLKIVIKYSTGIILFTMSIIVASSILSITYNSTSDFALARLVILNVFTFSGAYTISVLTKSIYHEVKFSILAKYLVKASVIQMILSLVLFFIPDTTSLLTKLLAFSDLEAETMNRLEGYRLLGFGTTFFTSGIIHSFVLIIIVILLQVEQLSFCKTFFYIIAFIIIAIIGMMLARTTIVGIVLALILSLFKANFWHLILSKKLRNIFKSVLLVSSIIICIIINLPPEMIKSLSIVYNFGFEIFENYFSSGEIRTGSTDVMFAMYIFPNNWQTWLIGDGYFADPMDTGFSYYMATDIGFIRLLFYMGSLGVIVFYSYQLIIIYQVYLKNRYLGIIPFIFIFTLFFILNLKGFTDLFFLIVLFYFCSNKESIRLLE